MKTRSELNQQAENLETEINQLEEKIRKEKMESTKIEEIIENAGILRDKHSIILQLQHHFKASGENRKGGEDKILDDLQKWVLKIYESCIGENMVNILNDM